MKVKLKDGKVVDAVARNGRVFQILPKGQRPLHKGTFTTIIYEAEEFPMTVESPQIEEGDDGSFDPSRIVARTATAEQASAVVVEDEPVTTDLPQVIPDRPVDTIPDKSEDLDPDSVAEEEE